MTIGSRLLAPLGTRTRRCPLLLWHKCEVPTSSGNVRVRGQSGKHLLALSSSQFDPKATSEAPNDKCSYGRLPLSKACSSR
jgi:hypothetical protein